MGDLTRSVGVVVMVITAIVGCSPKRYAINTVSDILSSGDSVYENDDDIILVGEALPFGLKFVESMLAQSPDHRGLLLTASRGYVLYSYAYVDFDSEQVAQKNLSESRELRSRARKLYLRALDYSLRAIDVTYPGFSQQLPVDPEVAVARVGTRRKDLDIASLYWAAASLGLAISVSKNNTSMLARLPEVDALVQRAFVIEPDWNKGVLHELAITLAASRRTGVELAALRSHYQMALELSHGNRAGVYVSYAEAVSTRTQNREEFEQLLNQALAVDINVDKSNRLINVIAQRRARWLLDRADELFL